MNKEINVGIFKLPGRTVHYFRNCSIFKFALFIGICGGIVNVLVDIDHAPMFWGGTASRALHPALLISAGIVALCYSACLAGCVARLVLEKKKKEKEREKNER